MGTSLATPILIQFEMAVEEENYDILTHPVMKELIHQKWKNYVRFVHDKY